MGAQDEYKAVALAEVNARILEVAYESPSESSDWEFFCECGKSDCHEHVSLTIDGFVAIRDRGGAVLAPGHTSNRAARSRQLVEE